MPAPFAAERVLGRPDALDVLERLADTLRRGGYDNRPVDVAGALGAATQFALGHAVRRHDLGARDGDALAAAGAADLLDDRVVPRFAVFAAHGVLVLVPLDEVKDPDRVYFGKDSLWLAEMALGLDPGDGWYADLGTGAGAVAALVAARYPRAVATELRPRAAACAAITFRLNPRGDGRPAAAVCRSDVAGGLWPGAFALVTANPPWLPDIVDGDGPGTHAYVEGGATGFELPRRFVTEAAALLAPGGISVTFLMDSAWREGGRPLQSLVRGLRRLRYETRTVPTGAEDAWPHLVPSTVARVPHMVSTRHVALLVRRPPAGSPLDPSVERSRVPGSIHGRIGPTA